MLRIELLGDFALTLDALPVTAVNTPRLQSLLAYLVLHRLAPQPRRHVAPLFWPDSSEDQALTNLRKLLHQLRHTLPNADRYLWADAKAVQWRPDAPAADDVSAFQAAIAAGMLQEAVSLYRGELLPSCYDDWILPQRERLHQSYLDALEALALQAEDARNFPDAVGFAQRLVHSDPLREDSYRHLMRLHALNDDRAAAMHVYHTCATTLRRELAVEPSPVTREMYERLLHLETRVQVPAQLQVGMLPLVGRDQEWRQLQRIWRAVSGRPHLALIRGEAGIGKTRLAEELVEWVRRQGFAALTAHCYQAEGQLAFAPVAEWLRSHPLQGVNELWLSEVARLLPELLIEHPALPRPGPLSEDLQRLHLFKGLAHALMQGHPSLLLFLDDLQWCDRDTLDWVRYLLERHLEASSRVRLLIVATALSGEEPKPQINSLLASLNRSGQLTEIELGPLDAHATLSLASHVAGQELPPTLASLLHQGSEGYPLFVVEMVRAGLPRGETQAAAHGRDKLQSALPLPAKVRRVLEARLAQLSPSAREVVDLAATVGRAFTFEVLRRACDLDEGSLVHALDELWQRRIVREQSKGAYDFSHGKLREVAYAELSSARRRLLHRRAAEALEAVHKLDLGAVSGRIAVHYEQAGAIDPAIHYYVRAAEAARRVFANADALDYFRRADALMQTLPEGERCLRLPEVLEVQADVEQLSGERACARACYQRALDCLEPGETVARARLLRKIADSWLAGRKLDQAQKAYDRAGAELGEPPAGRDPDWWQERVQLLLSRLSWHYWAGDWQPMVALAEQARPVAERYGTPLQQIEFYQILARLGFRRDAYCLSEETVGHTRRALSMAQEVGDSSKIAETLFSHGFALLWHGDLDEAARTLELACESAERVGNVLLRCQALTYETVAERRRGNADRVRTLAEQSLTAARTARRDDYIGVAQGNLAWLAWRAGRLDEARTLGQADLQAQGQLPAVYPHQWVLLLPLIGVCNALGEVELAVGYARTLFEPQQHSLPHPLAGALRNALEAWEGGRPEAVQQQLGQAIASAVELHYL